MDCVLASMTLPARSCSAALHCRQRADYGIDIQYYRNDLSPDSCAASAPASAAADTAFDVTVTALETFRGLLTGYTGTVQMTSSDPLAELPARYTAADAGVHTFSIALATSGNQTLTTTDTADATRICHGS